MTSCKPAIFGLLSFAMVSLGAAAPAAAQYRPRPLNAPTPGENYHIEGAIDYWNPTADVTITSTSGGSAGTDVDFKNDLGLTDQKFPAFHAQLKAGRHKLRFQYVPIAYTQSGTLGRDVVFNGQRYRAGLSVNSTLDWKAYRFGYEFDAIQQPKGFLGLVLEMKYTNVSATLTAVGAGATAVAATDQERAPIPAIGGVGRVYVVPSFAITADITAFALPGGAIKNATGHFVDADIYGTLNFNNNVGVQGGYRAFDVSYGFKTDSGSFALRGPYFGVVVRY